MNSKKTIVNALLGFS